jgi:hypothetical protein
MTLEATPPSVPITGNLRILFVPASVTDPLSLATGVGAAAAKDLTFSLTPTGWRPAVSENSISDGRMAQKQILNQPGNFSETLEVQYVYGTPDRDVANTVLLEGVEGFIVVREAIANETAWAAEQIVDVYAIKCGKQRKDPPAENALFTKTQGLYLTAPTLRDVAISA